MAGGLLIWRSASVDRLIRRIGTAPKNSAFCWRREWNDGNDAKHLGLVRIPSTGMGEMKRILLWHFILNRGGCFLLCGKRTSSGVIICRLRHGNRFAPSDKYHTFRCAPHRQLPNRWNWKVKKKTFVYMPVGIGRVCWLWLCASDGRVAEMELLILTARYELERTVAMAMVHRLWNVAYVPHTFREWDYYLLYPREILREYMASNGSARVVGRHW